MNIWQKLVFATGAIAGGCSSAAVGTQTSSSEPVGETSEAIQVGGRLGFQVYSANSTSGAPGVVMCPSDRYAVGGGANCDDGDFSTSYPVSGADGFGNTVPVGWAHWHRGAATNCTVYAVCAPRAWFVPGDIQEISSATGQNPNWVSCTDTFGEGYYAVGGGSRCTDGDFDVAYPDDGSDWLDWHRGRTSGDCTAYAVCVNKSNFVAAATFVTSNFTGYGNGSVTCSGGTTLSGGAHCSDGDIDYSYPVTNLTGWSEHHRGASSNDCNVYANCLPDWMYNTVQPGNPCSSTATRDCNNRCIANTTMMNAQNNFSCDSGSSVNLNCSAFHFDNGFCVN